MGRICYVFPHPDDESFGPAPALARHSRRGHDVCLLTLTRGEATKQRFKYGYTKAEMGEVRYREMQNVARVLGLNDLTVLGFPDGELSELDPQPIEKAVAEYIQRVRPDIVVTYPVHGISGHPDHLVGHAVVKRVFCALRADGASNLKRLAFFTVTQDARPGRPAHLKGSPAEMIDCNLAVNEADLEKGRQALACYETYQDVIAAHEPLAEVVHGVSYEIFQEHFFPPLNDIFAGFEMD